MSSPRERTISSAASPDHSLSPKTLGVESIPTRLGWISFFNDCSSEVIARALPLFLTTGLGMTPAFVGVVEGAAEAVGIFLRGFSGWFSDRMASRKPLVVFGYAVSVLSRVFLLAVQIPALFGLARIFDRTGKGLRSAPRDAMVADAAALGMNGRAFGVVRFLDTLGAMTGISVVLLLGIGTGAVDRETFRQCVLVAIPFGIVSLAILVFAVPRVIRVTRAKTYISWNVPREARGYLVAVGIFALGNSSDAFLVLKANQLGFSFRETLILMLAFNGLAALLAIPVGKLSDRVGRFKVLAFGWLVYAGAYLAIAFAESTAAFAGAVLVYGAFYGFTEGTEKALLADILPADKRGAGFGSLQLVLGIAALPASMITGWLMTEYGSRTAFGACALFAVIGIIALLAWRHAVRAQTRR